MNRAGLARNEWRALLKRDVAMTERLRETLLDPDQ